MNFDIQLRRIQHRWIPWSFYNGAKLFYRRLLSDKGTIFTSIIAAMNEDEPSFVSPYTASDFQVKLFPLKHSDGSILRITMPKPTLETQCYQVFLVSSSDFSRLFYFTLELNRSNGYYLCGWDVEHRYIIFHFDYTGCDDEVLNAVDCIFAS